MRLNTDFTIFWTPLLGEFVLEVSQKMAKRQFGNIFSTSSVTVLQHMLHCKKIHFTIFFFVVLNW